jgi:hypothetical protein
MYACNHEVTIGSDVFYAVDVEATWGVNLELRVSSVRELQLKGASQQGQELLDTKAKDATLLEATTRQCVWGH